MSGFLARWSQRKLAEKEDEAPLPEPEAEAPPPEVVAEAAPPAPEPEEPEPEFDLASLPSLDSLHAGSDFTAFLKRGVPLALKHAALRKAWVADPLIRDFRNPLDYGWDFNAPGGMPLGFSDTLGETADVLKKLLRQAVGERDPEEEPAPEAPPEQAPEEAPVLMAEAPEPPPEAAEPVTEPDVPRRRHGGALPS